MTRRAARTPGFVLLLLLVTAGPVAAGAPAPDDPLLATVSADSVRLSDLRLELSRMLGTRQGDAPLVLPSAADVLKRLVENRLLEQEGYRLGLDRTPDVAGQVADLIHQKSMAALLDSAAASVPERTPKLVEARQAAVRSYVEALKRRAGARVDAKLLASLDYASADSLVQKALRTREDVVATVPGHQLTVRALTRKIRFTAFHGLQGRKDAGETRDKVCDEWVVESLLTAEAQARGTADRPALRRLARLYERDLVREATLTGMLGFTFRPKDREVEAFYHAHLADFTPVARIKVESALLEKEAAARQFQERLRSGAKFRWLVERTAEVQKDISPFPAEWIEPRALGLKPQEVAVGKVLDPYGVPGGWAVAIVAEIESVRPAPLAEAHDKVLAMMKAQRTRETLAEALRRLEGAAQVRTAPDALPLVERTLAETRAAEAAAAEARAAEARAAAAKAADQNAKGGKP